jgi:agmatine deiminase
MQARVAFLVATAIVFALASDARAQRESRPESHTPVPGLPGAERWLYHPVDLSSLAPTPPPSGPVRNVVEFERNEAVLIRNPKDSSSLPMGLIVAFSEHVRVITIVGDQQELNQATAAFEAAGVHMENVEFLVAEAIEFWTRDFGPFFIADGNGDIGIVDFIYEGNWAPSNAMPARLADHLGLPYFAMDIMHSGGNYMTDGRGISASTNRIWSNNDFDQLRVLQRMRDYLGVHTYHVTSDPTGMLIRHIDTWAKFLDVDKILIAQVPSTHPRFTQHEAVASYYASQTSAYGTPFQVFRVPTPNGQPYTNSLILNERVYVPLMNSPWDEAALEAYRQAMPGYEVLGFTGYWFPFDAIHCRTKEITDRGMLYIGHTPVAGEVPYQPSMEFEVEIYPHSGQPLLQDELFLIYRAGSAPFDTLALAHVSGRTYSATMPIPGPDTEIAYYFSASDASGRTEHFPLVGPAGARTFTVVSSKVSTEPEAAGGAVRFEGPFPNPSVGEAAVRYFVDAPGAVTLAVFDLLGREVRRIVDESKSAGWHEAVLPADLEAGTYVVRLSAGGGRAARLFTRVR